MSPTATAPAKTRPSRAKRPEDRLTPGRKLTYRPAYHDPIIYGLARLGATLAQIAEALQISRATLYLWQDQFPSLVDAIKRARDAADDEVQRSLFERARGYTKDKVTVRKVGSEVSVTKETVFIPPDTTACIFWLKNRQRAAWSDRQELDLTGAAGALAGAAGGVVNVTVNLFKDSPSNVLRTYPAARNAAGGSKGGALTGPEDGRIPQAKGNNGNGNGSAAPQAGEGEASEPPGAN